LLFIDIIDIIVIAMLYSGKALWAEKISSDVEKQQRQRQSPPKSDPTLGRLEELVESGKT